MTWNRLELTQKCIDSLKRYTEKEINILIADNASADGTRDYLTKLYDEGVIDKLILLNRNYGIAAASNCLWELSDADYFVKLDNDIEINQAGWTEPFLNILKAGKRNNIGAVSYNFYRNAPDAPVVNQVESEGVRFEIPQNTAEIYGGCVFINKAIHKELGFWCEDFGRYGWEDTDYGIRLMLSGYNCAFIREDNLMLHHGETEDVKDEKYMDFKQKKFNDLSKMMAANFFMYLLGIKSKKAERRYILKPEYSLDRLKYSLDVDSVLSESEEIKEFRRFLRNAKMEISFPRNIKDSQELFEKYKLLKEMWLNRQV